LKVAEIQRRGLIHFHVVVRADGPNGINSDPPEWLTWPVLEASLSNVVSDVVAARADGLVIRWGKVFEVQVLATGDENAGKVSSYVAKYSSKSTDGSLEMARQFKSRRQIRQLIDDPHLRTMALTSWDLALEPQWSNLHLARHAHAFGFTGQLLTKSREFSTTFAALREARSRFKAVEGERTVIEGTSRYEGRGYDHPRAAEVADFLARTQIEVRRELAERRRTETQVERAIDISTEIPKEDV
jgi:hypothetical protein